MALRTALAPLAVACLLISPAQPVTRPAHDDGHLVAFAACTGAANCRACRNCSRCAHCRAGGTCGVCAGAPIPRAVPVRLAAEAQDEAENPGDFGPVRATTPAPAPSPRRQPSPVEVLMRKLDAQKFSADEWMAERSRDARLYFDTAGPPPGLEPDPDGYPQPGGKGYLFCRTKAGVPVPQAIAESAPALAELLGLAFDRDRDGWSRAVVDGKIRFLGSGAPVEVIAHDHVPLPRHNLVAEVPIVRVFGDPDPSRRYWTPPFAAVKLVDPKELVGRKITQEQSNRAAVAQAILNNARELDRAGLKRSALNLYRRVVREYPEAEAANLAGELAGKIESQLRRERDAARAKKK